jgi:hypothetical protein
MKPDWSDPETSLMGIIAGSFVLLLIVFTYRLLIA